MESVSQRRLYGSPEIGERLRWRDRRRLVADTYHECGQRHSDTAAHAAWHVSVIFTKCM
jgi:hypothetical protein